MIYSSFKSVLKEVLLNYDKSRIFEGEHTKQDIISTLVLIQDDLDFLKKSQSNINDRLFLSLKENLLKLVDDFSEVNIAEEAAKMSIRLDINENSEAIFTHR